MATPLWKKLFEATEKEDEKEIKRLIEDEKVLLVAVDHNEQTVAHIAAQKGNLNLLKYFLSKNNKLIDIKDKLDQTIFHVAVKNGHLELIKYLVIDWGVNLVDQKNLLKGNTAVHIVAYEGNLPILKYFLEDFQINVNIRNNEGETPLMYAARGVKLDVVKYLIEDAKADPTLLDHYDANVLYQSARMGDVSVPRYLLDEKKINLDVNWKNLFELTIMFLATRFNHLNFIKYLVEEKKADIDIPNNQGWTPLFEAADEGHFEIVKYLVEHNAAIEKTEMHGKKAIDIAKKAEIIEFLDKAAKARNSTTSARSRRSVNELFVRHSLHPQTPIPCKWIQKMITEHSWSSGQVDNYNPKTVDGVSSLHLDSFLMLAGACARYATGVGYQEAKHQSLYSPQEIVQDRMDPIAFDAVDAMYDFEYPHIN